MWTDLLQVKASTPYFLMRLQSAQKIGLGTRLYESLCVDRLTHSNSRTCLGYVGIDLAHGLLQHQLVSSKKLS